MSDKRKQDEDDESAILLEELGGESQQKQSIQINDDDEEMLLLSSPSPQPSPPTNAKKMMSSEGAGPSGMQKSTKFSSKFGDFKTSMNSNIIIDDSSDSSSDEDEEEDSSIEVIGSEDEEDDEMDEESESEETLSAFLDGKVQIFMAQGSFFIWNAEDVHMLREECRIVGKLVGCLPRAPRQNNQLGLPLQLMPEEAKLLEEIEAACVVVEADTIPDDIGILRKTSFESMRKENFKSQQKMYRESRKEEIRQNKHKIMEGKKAKKRKMQEIESMEKKSSKKVEQSESDTKMNESVSDPEGDKSEEKGIGKNASDSEAVAKVDSDGNQLTESDVAKSENGDKKDLVDEEKSETNVVDKVSEPGEDTKDSGEQKDGGDAKKKGDDIIADEGEDGDDDDEFDVDGLVTEETHVKHSLVQLFTENPWKENVKRPKHWIYPLSQKEFLRYEVFRDLWKKGYFLTSGSKFGGDFLVYPGDPARFHSHFIAVCIDKTVDLSALDIVSLGRLGSNVRKSVLLCAFNQTKQIVYTSLQWTGIS